jgi:hypothetical protein
MEAEKYLGNNTSKDTNKDYLVAIEWKKRIPAFSNGGRKSRSSNSCMLAGFEIRFMHSNLVDLSATLDVDMSK